MSLTTSRSASRIYLDHNATTPVHPEVLKIMLPYYTEFFGNPSSVHAFGREARVAVEGAREVVADALGARPSEIYFTSGGTESNNLAVQGAVYAYRCRGNHIITTQVEHHAILHTCRYLEQCGYAVTYLPVDRYGMVDPDEVYRAITDRTVLLSVMHANNEVGTVQPIQEIGRIAREKGVLFHTDAVQTFGKGPVEVDDLGVDLLSLSAHKIYGPKGIGVLYVRQGVEITPIVHGGSHEGNRRAGTEYVPGIVGLGKAVQIARADMEVEARRERDLRDKLEKAIIEEIEGVYLNGHPAERMPGTLNLSFEGIEGEALILSLDLEGIAVSSGSACMAGIEDPSHVLLAMGLDPSLAGSSVRFGFGRSNTAEEVACVLQVLGSIVRRLRDISVF